MTTRQALVQTLVELGVDYAFTLPGLGITWMLREFYETKDKLRIVLARSEQTASIMAQVVGRLTGKPGVYMGQGPFASTTGAFGILEAYFSGSPMLVLTDTSCYDGFGMYGVYQTMTGDYGAGDVRTVMRTITKASWYATEPHEAIYAVQQAYKQAGLARKGPCAVVMKSPIIKRELTDQKRVTLYQSAGYQNVSLPKPDPVAVRALANRIKTARHPVLIAGNGIQSTQGRPLLAHLAEKFGLAVATSYNAKGIVDETSAIAVGMLGTWGMKSANAAIEQADVVVALGASLGPDYLKFRAPEFICPGDQYLAQVDIDPRNAGWVYPVDLAIAADGVDVMEQLLQLDLGESRRADRIAWIRQLQADYPPFHESTNSAPGTVNNTDIIEALDAFLTPEDMLTLDAGTNRIWATSTLKIRTPGQLVVGGGMGGMGWGAPAAAAVKLVYPEKNVLCLTGDGGLAMTVNILATCVQESLPITVIVSNNSGLGMVRDNLQDHRIGVDFSKTDFAKVAEGMGCIGKTATTRAEIDQALSEARHAKLPTVIDVIVDERSSHVPASDY